MLVRLFRIWLISIESYLLLLRLILIIVVLIADIIILIIILVKLGKVILIQLLKGEGLASEPVDGTRDQLLLNVLSQLVVELEALLNVGSGIVVILGRGLGGREEVEEGFGRDRLLDNASLLGGFVWSAP